VLSMTCCSLDDFPLYLVRSQPFIALGGVYVLCGALAQDLAVTISYYYSNDMLAINFIPIFSKNKSARPPVLANEFPRHDHVSSPEVTR
jgi:hypothetical protein